MSNLVPAGWAFAKFGDLAKVQNGYAFKSSDFSEQGYAAAIRMSNLKSGRIDLSDAKYVREDIVDGLDQFRLTDGDFLFGMSGSLDNYAWMTESSGVCYLNQRVGCLRTKADADPLFASYCYLSEAVKSEIVSLAAGAAQLNISGSQLEAIPVQLPPLPEQQKIATILSSVDDVIEKTRAQIDKLKDLKTGMMQELLTKGIGSDGVPHTEFKDSPVGRIPVGWNCKTIGELLEFKNGLNKEKEYFGRGNPIVNFTDVFHRHGITLSDLAGKVELTQPEQERFEVRQGDVFFTRTSEVPNEIGMSAVFLDQAENVSFSGFTLRGRPVTNMLEIQFCKYCFSSEYVRKQIVSSCSYTTRALTNGTLLSQCLIAIPPKQEQLKIAQSLDSIDDVIQSKARKLRTTLHTKKALMQDLLTGKVRVNVTTDQRESVVA